MAANMLEALIPAAADETVGGIIDALADPVVELVDSIASALEVYDGEDAKSDGKKAEKAERVEKAKIQAPTAAKATIGGVERIVGGWAEYVVSRRRAGWEISKTRPNTNYAGRTVIGAADVVSSINRPLALQDAIGLFSTALKTYEQKLPTLVRGGAEIARAPALSAGDFEGIDVTDFDELHDAAVSASGAAAAAGSSGGPGRPPRPPAWPALPTRAVSTADDPAVLRLESAVLPYVSALETYQAAVASHLDKAAAAIAAQ